MDANVKAIKIYAEALLETIQKYEDGQTNGILVMHDARHYTEWTQEVVDKVLA